MQSQKHDDVLPRPPPVVVNSQKLTTPLQTVLHSSPAWHGHEFRRLQTPLVDRLVQMRNGKTLHSLPRALPSAGLDDECAFSGSSDIRRDTSSRSSSLKPFVDAVQQETVLMTIPENVSPPMCYCSFNCALRLISHSVQDVGKGFLHSAANEQSRPDGGDEIWVCSKLRCMYVQRRDNSFERCDSDSSSCSTETPDVDTVVEKRRKSAGEAQIVSLKQEFDSLKQEHSQPQCSSAMPRVVEQPMKSADAVQMVSVDQYWQGASQVMVIPADDLAVLLKPFMVECDCGRRCERTLFFA